MPDFCILLDIGDFLVVCLESSGRKGNCLERERMKRGKDEGKITGPMFPRLHVNDTEKGGPKAPPRNKMALYEQLSVPSQRFNQSTRPVNSNSEHASSQVIF